MESQKNDATNPVFEETNNQQNSISTTATIEERDRPSLDTVSMSSAKKRRINKLNVSAEKNEKLPRVVENIKLTPNSKYDLNRIVPSSDTSRAIKASNLLKESHDREEDAANTSSNLSKAPLKVSREMGASNEDISLTKIKDISSTNLSMEAPCIMLEEGKNVLNNDQVNQIIDIENSKSRHAGNRYREENAESNVCPDLSQSPRKKLTMQTPEKLDESTKERKRIFNAAQVSIKNSPDLTVENRLTTA